MYSFIFLRSVFSFDCSSVVFSSSSDSSSSDVSLALFLVLDAVAWGSSEMQNSTIVRSITNQKSCFHLQTFNFFYFFLSSKKALIGNLAFRIGVTISG